MYISSLGAYIIALKRGMQVMALKVKGNKNEERLFLSCVSYIYSLLDNITTPLCFACGDV